MPEPAQRASLELQPGAPSGAAPSAGGLPTGTLTLVFTDIEGSTGLLRELGNAYAGMLSDHARLLREAFAEHGGVEIDAHADSMFAVFRRGADAVAAAIDAQRALAAHRWPGERAPRVRMGMHTAEPLVAGNRYVGLGVHRAARICEAAHGGQVLLSQATCEVLADERVAGVDVRSLGAFCLRGIERSEQLHQLVAPGLLDAFPPPRAAPCEQAGTATPTRLRVVIADDSTLIREGVALVLEQAGFDVVARVSDAAALLATVDAERPDLAIVDIRMPPTNTDEGVRAAQRLQERYPQMGVLVLSQHVDLAYALSLVTERSQRIGYLLKDRIIDTDAVAAALRHIAAGGSAIDPSLVAELVAAPRQRRRLDELTERERDVLALMAEGQTDAGIAERLGLGVETVEHDVDAIFGKLDLPAGSSDHRRVHAVLTFLRG